MSYAGAQLITEDEEQDQVNGYFESAAAYWRDIYFDTRLQPTIYRDRQNIAFRWIRKLRLPLSSRVLEIGCGAGFLSVALARKGYWIDAMDSTPAMIELTRTNAARSRVARRINTCEGDVHSLLMAENEYDIVVALGVIPWLHSEERALVEMRRILKPGGFLLITADNEVRLNRVLDPRSTPLLKPIRKTVKYIVQTFAGSCGISTQFEPKRHYPSEIDAMIKRVGLSKVQSAAIGFGPFTFFGKPVLSDHAGVWLHRRLQRLSLHGVAGIRAVGSHYLLLARKPC
jgi:2-polyprenyl-3-methyl-5-hydroxy-6-metoxy-1,4-benzoquinol methylase